MTTKERVVYWLNAAITTLNNFKAIIPGKIDDLAVSFLEWAVQDTTFLEFLDNFDAPEDAIIEPPAAVIESLRRWRVAQESAGAPIPQGTYMELLGYILNIIRWISARKATQPA